MGTLRMTMDRGPGPDRFDLTDADFERLRSLIRATAGIDLRDVKRALLRARLTRRLRHHGYTSFAEYWAHLRDRDPHGQERIAMVNAITTTKTEFFREPHHFAFLRARVLPEAAARRPDGGVPKLRVWSAACSTGEEPYSIALTILDAEVPTAAWDVRILASDINTDVLAVGEAGVYPEDRLAHVDAGARRRHFRGGVPGEPHLARVSAAARQLITFRCINLCAPSWPIHTAFDVVFCRNAIIYFDRATQRAVIRRLVEYVAPGGYLVLGHSESLLGQGLGLEYVGQTVYRKPAAAADVVA